MSKELKNLSNAMADAVEEAGASTVMVNARRRIPASGIALTKEIILTAHHVVERDEDITVTLPDGEELSAELIGRDPGTDLALLKLEKAAATPAKTNGEPRVGELVLALGRPSTDGIQASLGIVSAIGGPVRTRRGGHLESHLRTDATPYPGFSGGPLIDAEGKIVGINTSGHGYALTIPIETAQKIAAHLEKHGSVKRGYLGIRSQLVDLPTKAKKDHKLENDTGLLVIGLEENSPAGDAGVIIGDIIIGINDQPVANHEELMAHLTGDVVGSPTPMQVLRGGQPETIKVTVAERKPETQKRRRRMRTFSHQVPGGRHGRDRHSRGRPQVWIQKYSDDD